MNGQPEGAGTKAQLQPVRTLFSLSFGRDIVLLQMT